jgi:hypothetical protein
VRADEYLELTRLLARTFARAQRQPATQQLLMECDLRQFVQILSASYARIDAGYFQLPQADGDSVYRERVYCYELYHQMRAMWGQFPYSLGGEVDKSGHALFRGGPYAQAKPDFLVHVPGDMGQNLAGS